MSLSERLGSLSNVRDDHNSPRRDEGGGGENNNMNAIPGTPTIGSSNLIQRCVIVQRDEKGYGLTVSGDNPVFVQSVKIDGAAHRAGVQEGDQIIKVNGSCVTNSNHTDVVQLIKSGSYVALTLLGKPPMGSSNRESSGGSNRDSFVGSNRDSIGDRLVTAPRPVNAEKDRELREQKINTLRVMLDKATSELEKLKRSSTRNPSDKLQAQVTDRERTVRTLEIQLKAQTDQPDPNISPGPIATVIPGSELSNMEQNSTPWATSLPATISDGGSTSDSPQTSPNTSPTPLHPGNLKNTDMDSDSTKPDSGIDESSQGSVSVNPSRDIIGMDDEDFESEEEHQLDEQSHTVPVASPFLQKLQTLETDDHGPFSDITQLESKPAHMAIFLHYLISNSDPSALFFYLVTNVYSQAQGGPRDLRKWAYEIHSTFLVLNAPLKVNMDENLVTDVDKLLQYKSDKEDVLRSLFQHSRTAALNEIQELLQDFRQKKDLGLGNIYGAHELKDNMEKNAELKTIEKYLMPHLERFQQNGADNRSQRDIAMGWALATFLRSVGVAKISHNSVMERIQSFVMKEKKGLKLPGSNKPRSKVHKGHQFAPQHYYKVEFCMQCGSIIWGIGYQGFMCQTCDQNIHKQCIDDLEETCKKKRMRSTGIIPGWRKSILPPGDVISRLALPDIWNKAAPMYQAVKEVEKDVSSSTILQDPNVFNIEPAQTEEDSELSKIRDGHSVGKLVDRYNTIGKDGEDKVDGETPPNSGSTKLVRANSSRGKEKRDRPTRRTASDLEMNDDIVESILRDKSGSSSSLSNRSIDSPSTSSETVDTIIYDPDLEVDTELPPLKHIIPEDVLKKLKPKEKKRQDVLNELFHTEKAHVRNLKILDKIFYRPMLKANISQDLIQALFPNLAAVILLHSSINNEMKARRQENPVVKKVSDILLRRFDSEEGEQFRNGCAIFCRNQSHAIEALKLRQKKDQRLSQFLSDAESNPLCRRLQLKDLVPAQMQRLTKYPMLIENLLKYTQTNTEEHSHLQRAHQCSKHILEFVNQAVRDCENQQRLVELQRRIDKKQVENSSDPELIEELKALDLKKHKLVNDGPLTWRINPRKNIELHVVLLEDMVVLLQKQDDKLVLKCQSSQLVPGRDELKHTHSPLLRLSELLIRNAATDKRAFFAVNTSKSGPQIYELVAPTADEQKKWSKHISQAAEAYKNRELRPSRTVVQQISNNQPEVITSIRDTISVDDNSVDNTMEEDQPECLSDRDKENLTMIRASEKLVQPDEVIVSDAVLETAKSLLTPIELLQLNDEKIQECLQAREWLVAEVFNIPHMDVSQRVKAAKEAGIEGKAEDLMMSFIQQSNEMITLIANCSQDLIASQDVPESTKEELQQLTIPIPMGKLHEMASRMNQILTNLLESTRTSKFPANGAVINSRDEERERLRTELKTAQEQLNLLREIQKATASAYANKVRPSSMISETSTTSESCDENNVPQVEITQAEVQETSEDLIPLQNHIDNLIARDEGLIIDNTEDLQEIEPPEEDRMDDFLPEQVDRESDEDEKDGEEEEPIPAVQEVDVGSAALPEAEIHQIAEFKTEEATEEQVIDTNPTEIVQNLDDDRAELQHTESEELFEDATDRLDTTSEFQNQSENELSQTTHKSLETHKTAPDNISDLTKTEQQLENLSEAEDFVSLDNLCTEKESEVCSVLDNAGVTEISEKCDDKDIGDLESDENSTDLDAVMMESAIQNKNQPEQTDSVQGSLDVNSLSNWGEEAPPSVEI